MSRGKYLRIAAPSAGTLEDLSVSAAGSGPGNCRRLVGEGLTVLVSTHYMDAADYMDGAERCHRIADTLE